jgi:hypothetical protein
MRPGDPNLHVGSRGGRNWLRAGEIDGLVLAASARDLPSSRVIAFNHHFDNLS